MPKEKIRVKATVESIDEKFIYLLPNSGKYDECGACDSLLCGKRSKVRKVPYRDGFKVNDEVFISSDSSMVLKHALMLYGLPVLVIFILAVLFSSLVKLSDMAVAVISIISLPITYFIIRNIYKDGCYNIDIERID